jgi:hypothetical protein
MSEPICNIEVKLVGEDGNIFSIMARVRKAMERGGYGDEAKDYTQEVMSCGSYDEALRITMRYVNVC